MWSFAGSFNRFWRQCVKMLDESSSAENYSRYLLNFDRWIIFKVSCHLSLQNTSDMRHWVQTSFHPVTLTFKIEGDGSRSSRALLWGCLATRKPQLFSSHSLLHHEPNTCISAYAQRHGLVGTQQWTVQMKRAQMVSIYICIVVLLHLS